MTPDEIKTLLNKVYGKYHKRKFVKPDPLQFLYEYPDPKDREIVGLIASAFALGRVKSILSIVEKILSRLPSPKESLLNMTEKELPGRFKDVGYRFYTPGHISAFLLGIRKAVITYGSLENCFLQSYSKKDDNVQSTLISFYKTLFCPRVLPDPEKKSASKRLHLFLRWMVRKDKIDPGGWDQVSKKQLLVPLDTHLYKISTLLGFTNRKSQDLMTTLEVTRAFRKYAPADPVKYDFSLTRIGIHPDNSYARWFDN